MKMRTFWKIVGFRALKGAVSIFLSQLVVVATHNPLWIWAAPIILAVEKAMKEKTKHNLK